MTNEELDRARVDEAMRLWDGSKGSLAVIAARLAREGWTPPVAVDPDREEAITLAKKFGLAHYVPVLDGIKRGRELERAEAKPGRWSSWNGAPSSPVCDNDWVCVIYDDQSQAVGRAGDRGWEEVSSYLPIPKPEDVA